jgi:hypothetical protein
MDLDCHHVVTTHYFLPHMIWLITGIMSGAIDIES